ncbi:MAG: VWA domain-containing protein [Kiritimatiellae bacterium]|nr:VWA domain-containing protein [Kiritimatiellia bacterium]
MNKTFKQEWELYKAAGRRPSFAGETPREEAEFDAPVKVGEIRVFADMARPFVALVAEDRGNAGFFIVPVSPFTIPASPRELLEGERVYQLWNACTASRGFVARSWIVESADSDTLAAVRGKCAAKTEIAAEGPVAEYEREFLVSGGDFIPLVNKDIPRVVHVPARKSWTVRIAEALAKSDDGIHVSWRKICGLAACFAILLGMSVFLFDLPRAGNRMCSFDSGFRGEVAVLPEIGCHCELLEEPSSPPTEASDIISQELIRDLGKQDIPVYSAVTPPPAQISVRPAPMDSVAFVSSPVKMKSMVGSRMPGSVGAMTRGGASFEWKGRLRRDVLAENQPVGTERYAEIQENDYRDPTSEPLSTFGLDVDTSSYTTMRRYLTEMKRLPPKDSVRIEEYVNYFKYRYPQPTGDEPIAVACEMGVCPWAPAHKLLRVGVQAREVPVDKLPPCNLTFLIDVSGSMGGNGGFEMMKAGLKMLIGRLRPEDHVAIVTYASGTHVRLASTPGSEKERIRSAVDDLRCGGCTYGAGGIQLAYEEAKKNFDRKANNRVVLVTDGDFNVGISDPKALEDFIATKRESGVFLTVIGVGRGNYQDATMKKLSTAGNGNYAYLDSVLEAKKVMINEFGGTLFTVAKDVKLQLEFNPAEVKGYRLLGYESRKLAAKDFNDDKKDAGEIGSGHTMTAFYEIVPAGSEEKVADVDPLKYQKRTESGRGEVCTAKLRWKKPDGDKSVLKEIPVSEAAITLKTPSEDFRFASAVAEFALLLKDSKFSGEASFGAVLERARGAKGEDGNGYRAEFIRLVEAAELLRRD